MATTRLLMANAALSVLGATPVVGLDDNSAESDAVNAVWDTTLRDVLSRGTWQWLRSTGMTEPFSEREARLRQNQHPIPDKWEAASRLPADVLTLINVTQTDGEELTFNPQTQTQYEITTYTNISRQIVLSMHTEPLLAKYTRLSVEDVEGDLVLARMPAFMEPPLKYILGLQLALLLTDDTEKITKFAELYNNAIDTATYIDAQSVPSRPTKSKVPQIRRGARFGRQ